MPRRMKMRVKIETLAAVVLSSLATSLYHKSIDANRRNGDVGGEDGDVGNEPTEGSPPDARSRPPPPEQRRLPARPPKHVGDAESGDAGSGDAGSQSLIPDEVFYYDDNESDSWYVRKTYSYMPYMPALDGHMKTHGTYRFFTVREQVLTVIGEAKHGLWREQESGHVRLYRVHGAEGLPVGVDVYDPAVLESGRLQDYKPILIPGEETIDEEGWAGYRYTQEDDGDGQAAFVDVDIYHPYFEGKYDDYPVIDLPNFMCTMSAYNYPDAKEAWDYVKVQPNANQIGPLGMRAGLGITDLYTSALKIDLLPDANMWIQVGQGDAARDVFDQNDIDDGNMSMDVAFRVLDKANVDFEVYMVERTSFNVPYLYVTVVVDNKGNDHMRYVRPHGLYWDGLVGRGLTAGVKTEVTYDPDMPIVDRDGTPATKTMRYAPVSGLNTLDGWGYGNWCPQKGGDYMYYPNNPSGSGWPNQYEEVTPVCDGLVVDVKMYANLDVPTWDSPSFQLQNAGTRERKQTYRGIGNQFGDFTDPYLVENGMTNPHALHFTAESFTHESDYYYTESDHSDKPIQGITLKFEEVGETSHYVDPDTLVLTPATNGLTQKERRQRNRRLNQIEFPVQTVSPAPTTSSSPSTRPPPQPSSFPSTRVETNPPNNNAKTSKKSVKKSKSKAKSKKQNVF